MPNKIKLKTTCPSSSMVEASFFYSIFWEYNSRLLGIFNKIILFAPVRTAVNFIWWIFTSSKRQITYKNIMFLIKMENLSFNFKNIFFYCWFWFTMDMETKEFEMLRIYYELPKFIYPKITFIFMNKMWNRFFTCMYYRVG